MSATNQYRSQRQRSKLIKRLDDVFSVFIRKRSADEFGFVRCFTCQAMEHWKHMQCGHFVVRGNMSTRYDEVNCQPQCNECNQHKGGNEKVFEVNLDRKYGEGTADKLRLLGKKTCKIADFELELLIKHYSKVVNV